MFTQNDISVFIFNWKKTNENVVKLYNNVINHINDVCIINSDENYNFDSNINCLQLNDNYYYGGQYETAITNVKPDKIFCVIVGDNNYTINFEVLFEHAIDAFNNHNAGIYSPNDLRSPHTSHYDNIPNTNLYEVENTDCGIWFIHPIIVKPLRNIEYFNISNLGWGIDMITIRESRKKNLKVLRDYAIETNQMDNSTNYDSGKADLQMKSLIKLYENMIF